MLVPSGLALWAILLTSRVTKTYRRCVDDDGRRRGRRPGRSPPCRRATAGLRHCRRQRWSSAATLAMVPAELDRQGDPGLAPVTRPHCGQLQLCPSCCSPVPQKLHHRGDEHAAQGKPPRREPSLLKTCARRGRSRNHRGPSRLGCSGDRVCMRSPPAAVRLRALLRASDVAHRRRRGTRELVATEGNCDARARGRN